MLKILAVAAGGSLGAIVRYLISLIFVSDHNMKFPVATFIANMLGCFLMGILWKVFSGKIVSTEIKLFLMTGCLGALTTFSTYGIENFVFLKNKLYLSSVSYFLLSNAAALFFIFLGTHAARTLK